jgi:hypothetical protein
VNDAQISVCFSAPVKNICNNDTNDPGDKIKCNNSMAMQLKDYKNDFCVEMWHKKGTAIR